jgi:hypothetical protein
MFRRGKIPEYFKYLYQKYTHLLYVLTGAACFLLTKENAVDIYEYKLMYSLLVRVMIGLKLRSLAAKQQTLTS